MCIAHRERGREYYNLGITVVGFIEWGGVGPPITSLHGVEDRWCEEGGEGVNFRCSGWGVVEWESCL